MLLLNDIGSETEFSKHLAAVPPGFPASPLSYGHVQPSPSAWELLERNLSYWIKLETGFFTHRKTIRLRSIIGEDAFWVVPRLWCLAADQQPDGDFSGYTAHEIAMLIGYTKDAPSMLQALLQAGFLDSGQKLHGWIERNSFHITNRDRATKAALARWSRTTKTERGEEIRGEESIEHCSSIAPSNAPSIGRRYPSNLEEAKRMQPVSSVIPEDFVRKCFDKAQSRGGRDSKEILIMDFNAYVRIEWSYDQERIRGGNGKSTAQSIQRSKRRDILAAKVKRLEGELQYDFERERFPDKVKELEDSKAELSKLETEILHDT